MAGPSWVTDEKIDGREVMEDMEFLLRNVGMTILKTEEEAARIAVHENF